PASHSYPFLSSELCLRPLLLVVCSLFRDAATTALYTLSLHDALPILAPRERRHPSRTRCRPRCGGWAGVGLHGAQHPQAVLGLRSEEHTSELQSRENLVCRLLLEKKKKNRGQTNKDGVHAEARYAGPG